MNQAVPNYQYAQPGYEQNNDLEANLLQNEYFERENEGQAGERDQGIVPVDFQSNLTYSIKYNVLLLFVCLGKIIASGVVLGTAKYNINIKVVWIVLMLIHDSIYASMVVTTIQLIHKVNSVVGIAVNEAENQNQNPNPNPNNNNNNNQRNENNPPVDLLEPREQENNSPRDKNLENRENASPPRDNSPLRNNNQEAENNANPANPLVLNVAREITKKKKTIEKLTNFTDTYYFVIFLLGQMIYFLFDNKGEGQDSAINNLMLTYVLMGYLWLLSPVIIVMLACLCFPVLLLLFYFFGPRGAQVPATRAMIESLPVINYTPDIPGNKECAICMVDYEEGDKIIQLKCSNLHHFHDECIKHWLQINGTCPVCRKKLTEMVAPAT